jgi:3-dehydroquinate synthase
MAVIKDNKLFTLLEDSGSQLINSKFQNGRESQEVIERSIQGMIEELEPNLWENDMRRLVNFGHSFGPMVEMNALPELSHGEAVALDVLFSCVISAQRKLMPWPEVDRIYKTMRQLGLPTYHNLFSDQTTLQEGLADTVRHRNGAQELPIPVSIGRAVFINDVNHGELQAASEIMKNKYSL